MNVDAIEILLVEDSPGDIELVKTGLRSCRAANNLFVAKDGVEAIAYLEARAEHADRPRPDLVLLDINLPKMNGHEVLREIRGNPALATLPVIVLTTSDHDRDIQHAYERHANAYIQKPLNGIDFIEAIQKIAEFWLTLVRLPNVQKQAS